MDHLAEQFLEHPRRRWFVGGAVGLALLAVTLPAWEAYAAAAAEAADLDARLALARTEAESLGPLRARFAELKAAADPADPNAAGRGLTEPAAEALRERLVHAIAEAGLRQRSVLLSGPTATVWADGPPPAPGTPAAAAAGSLPKPEKEKARYELVSRRLAAEAVGPLRGVGQLLDWAAAADPHARPAGYELSFENPEGDGDRAVRVELDLLLLEVRPRPKDPAG